MKVTGCNFHFHLSFIERGKCWLCFCFQKFERASSLQSQPISPSGEKNAKQMEGKEKLTNNKELSHLEFPHSPVAPGGSEREDLTSQAQCSTSFQLLNVWVLTWVEVSSNSRRLCLFLPLSLSLWYCCLPPFWQQQAMGFGSFPLCPYSQGHWPLKY